ncbi:uncharacterized protein LOC106729438 isoform X4 [Camelus ferus]|uniref:Uncharacterized protein LOC106729438 isoform X4 n=1 Tax=Camelus ferus TaxID=419612 RepID=A0A8B8SLF7_CAMFR|nr:uncharacterized protein LOC106729438 isoform X4 [Camelus ferus]
MPHSHAPRQTLIGTARPDSPQPEQQEHEHEGPRFRREDEGRARTRRCACADAEQPELEEDGREPTAPGTAPGGGTRPGVWAAACCRRRCRRRAGYLIGSDVLRLLHGHMDECLTVPSGEHGEEQRRSVHYEVGAVSVHARSLWRLETLRVATLSYGNSSLHVDAAFQQTLWSVAPISSGSEAAQGYLIGSDVLRLLHGHMDECLTVPSGVHGEEQRRSVHYEVGAVSVHARSLWRLETLRVANLCP